MGLLMLTKVRSIPMLGTVPITVGSSSSASGSPVTPDTGNASWRKRHVVVKPETEPRRNDPDTCSTTKTLPTGVATGLVPLTSNASWNARFAGSSTERTFTGAAAVFTTLTSFEVWAYANETVPITTKTARIDKISLFIFLHWINQM